MWGGEAVAIRHDGRANPNQLMLTPATQASIAGLRDELVSAHRERFGPNADSDLYLGLQITHSGRFARPDVWDTSAPLAACHHPDSRQTIRRGVRVLTDDEIDTNCRGLRRRRAARIRLRLSVRGRKGVPRLSRARDARGHDATRQSTADRSSTACASSPRSSGRCAAPLRASASSCACRSLMSLRTERAPTAWACRSR